MNQNMDIKKYNSQHTRGQIRPQPRPVVIPQKPKVILSKVTYNATKNTINIINNTTSPSVDRKFMQPVLASDPIKNKIDKVANIKSRRQRINRSLAHAANKAILLSRLASNDNKTRTRRKKHSNNGLLARRIIFSLIIILLLASTGYVSFSTWQTNIKAEQIIKTIRLPVTDGVQKKETTDSSQSGTETKVSTASALNNYRVSSELPRAIYINKINVAARILPMGVNNDNSMQAPENIYDAGWYTSSAKPGQDGAMLIDGHASENNTHYGLFGYLADVKNGDEIIIERGDGVKFTYRVAEVKTEPLEGLDMSKMLVPYGSAKQGVNLIACAGEWTRDKSTLDHRLLVFAVLI